MDYTGILLLQLLTWIKLSRLIVIFYRAMRSNLGPIWHRFGDIADFCVPE